MAKSEDHHLAPPRISPIYREKTGGHWPTMIVLWILKVPPIVRPRKTVSLTTSMMVRIAVGFHAHDALMDLCQPFDPPGTRLRLKGDSRNTRLISSELSVDCGDSFLL